MYIYIYSRCIYIYSTYVYIYIYSMDLYLCGSLFPPDAGSTSPHVPVLLGGWRLSPAIPAAIYHLCLVQEYAGDICGIMGYIINLLICLYVIHILYI